MKGQEGRGDKNNQRGRKKQGWGSSRRWWDVGSRRFCGQRGGARGDVRMEGAQAVGREPG